MTRSLDAVLAVDPRFAGGTSAALVTDCRSLVEAGMSVGLCFLRSRFLDTGRDHENPSVLALLDLPGVERLREGAAVSAGAAFFHNPQIFADSFEGGVALSTDRPVIVTHHPPFRGDGSLEYDPFGVMRRLRTAFGVWPMWAPISEITRRQLCSFGPLLRLTAENWTNLFDPEDWQVERPIFDGPDAVVGRHGRADMLKWPDAPADVEASLPVDAGWRVRVLGCPAEALAARGVGVDRWEVLAFGAEDPRRFLASLDVFSYYTSSRWTEAFGRTIVEAMLTGRPALLDPRLEVTFGDLAQYPAPADVAAALARLRADPAAARQQAAAVRERCLREYGASSLAGRFQRLRRDPGVRGRLAIAAAPPYRTMRKLAGLHLRSARARVRARRGTPRAAR